MNIQSYVDQALARENQALNEYESKQVLEAAGLALPEEILALSPGDALAAANKKPHESPLPSGFPAAGDRWGATRPAARVRAVLRLSVIVWLARSRVS